MRFCFILLVLIGFKLNVYGQFGIEHYTISHGLPHGVVYDIAQDAQGFLWLAGEGGLVRFDGYRFKSFQHDPTDSTSISINSVSDLHADKNGKIWGGTWGGGLNIYDTKKARFESFRHNAKNANSLSDDRIQTIFEDKKGIFWIGTFAGGLNRFDYQKKEFQTFKHKPDNANSPSSNRIWCVTEDSQDNLWIGTENGLDVYNPKKQTWKHFYHTTDSSSLSHSRVRWVFMDSREQIWVSTQNGLNLFDEKTQTFRHFYYQENKPTTLGGNITYKIIEDKKGRLWIATYSQNYGISIFDPKTETFTRLAQGSEENNLPSNDVRGLFLDKSNMIWVGTRGSGLVKINPSEQKFQAYKRQHYPWLNNIVYGLSMDSQNRLWVGSDGGNIQILDKNTIQKKFLGENITIYTCLEDQDGYWVATLNEGLFRLNKNLDTIDHFSIKTPNALLGNKVWALVKDTKNRLWIGTDQALSCLDLSSKQLTHFQHDPKNANSLPHNSILSLYLQKNSLWIGTWGGGLAKLDLHSMRFTTYKNNPKDANSLSHNQVNDIKEDQEGNIWVATVGGLNKMTKNGKIEHFFEKDGLPANEISAIGIYKSQIWVSTIEGLAKIDPYDSSIKAFGLSDKIHSNEFERGVVAQRKDGKLFFGGIGGFTAFHPDSIFTSDFEPIIAITDFKIYNQSVENGILPDGRQLFENSINYAQEINLDYNDNLFFVEFSAFDYSFPQRIRYAYKLEGLHKDWIYTDASNRWATFTNLNPDSYVLRIKATNSDGVWTFKEHQIRIHISPPYWLTWWFRIGVGLLLVGLFTLFYLVRINRIAKKKDELERIVLERTAEVVERNAELAQINEELNTNMELIREKNNEIELKNRDITASINYASRIQRAILPELSQLQAILIHSFVLFKPRDIVSGDFYWFQEKAVFDEYLQTERLVSMLAVADCTGHGVPGSLMSMIGSNLLSDIARHQKGRPEPNKMLTELHQGVSRVLKQKETSNTDGMEIGICVIDWLNEELVFSASKHSLYMFENQHLQIIRGDKLQVGGEQFKNERDFTNYLISFKNSKQFYMSSDGYQDQFGGKDGKKFTSKRFKEMLIQIHDLPMPKQQEILDKTIHEWIKQADEKQIDDILVIGFQLGR